MDQYVDYEYSFYILKWQCFLILLLLASLLGKCPAGSLYRLLRGFD